MSTTFAALIEASSTTQEELAAHLDALSAEARVAETRALAARHQKRLWELCAGAAAFTLEDLVPPSVGEGQTVIYAGRNSLAAFSYFEKRFVRRGPEVVGYNHNPAIVTAVTGPGYFTAVPSPHDPRELLFDYTRTPSEAPDAWPPIKTNSGGLRKLVFGNLHDFNRRVSRDVLIGFATRLGKPIDSYFVLCRR